MADGLGVAVIGAGMAGRAHAAAYRTASALYSPVLPPIRLVSIGDVNAEFGSLAARRFGYERNDTSWQAIAEADDIDVVSVVIANSLHREVVEGLLAAGKHVLCEKPLSDTLEDARAMAEAARNASSIAKIGFTFRRTPGIAYIRELIQSGDLGKVLHFCGRYWTDYGCDPHGPMSWRFKGPRFRCAGRRRQPHGLRLRVPLRRHDVGQRRAAQHRDQRAAAAAGCRHGPRPRRGQRRLRAVTNDDYAAFSATFENGAGAIEVSRVAAGHANSLIFEVFCENGAARFDQRRPSEIELFLREGQSTETATGRSSSGPEHPYLSGGLAMDAPSVGFGQNDAFAYQARAFLEEVAGIDEGLAAPLRHLRRGRAQHGTARRRSRQSAPQQRKERSA